MFERRRADIPTPVTSAVFFTSVEETTYSLPDGTSSTYILYQADKFHAETSADVPDDRAALMLATQRPMDVAALNEPLTLAAWHSHVTEVHASHAVTLSHPDVVADVIEQAARATTK